MSPFNNISNPQVNTEPLKNYAEETRVLMQSIVDEYRANPQPEDILKFSTYHHALRVLQKIEQENASKTK